MPLLPTPLLHLAEVTSQTVSPSIIKRKANSKKQNSLCPAAEVPPAPIVGLEQGLTPPIELWRGFPIRS